MILKLIFCLCRLIEYHLVKGTYSSIYIERDASATFSWTLNPPPALNEPVTVENPNGESLFYALQKEFYRYSDRIVFPSIDDNWNLSFTLTNVTKLDAGVYSGSYTAGKFEGQDLIVLDKPVTPTIYELTSPVQGNRLELNCSTRSNSVSFHARLEMYYEWYIRDNSSLQRVTDNNSDSVFRIFNLTTNYQNKQIFCKAFEIKKLKSNISNAYKVDLQYGPRNIIFTPEKDMYRIPVYGTVPNVTCSANCNPVCKYTWQKDSQLILNGSVLQLQNIRGSDTGMYTCFSENRHGHLSSKGLQILVTNSPGKLHVAEITPPIEGSDLKLGCFENPADHSKTFYTFVKYQWSLPSDILIIPRRQTQNENFFELRDLQLTDNDIHISCNATTADGFTSVDSDKYIVKVVYGPKIVQHTSSRNVIKALSGDVLSNILCWSDCIPACKFKWHRVGFVKEFSTGSILSLGKITDGKAGDYYCEAYNKYGNKYSNSLKIEVTVIRINETTICTYNETCYLECRIEESRDQYTFLPWIHTIGKTILRSLEGIILNNVNQLTITNCNQFDLGMYTCRVVLEKHQSIHYSKDAELNVLGPPVFTGEDAKIVIKESTVSLSLKFQSIPSTITVQWLDNDTIIHGNGTKFEINTEVANISQTLHEKFITLSGFQTTLVIHNITETDFGVYIVVLSNSFGEVQREINFNGYKENVLVNEYIYIWIGGGAFAMVVFPGILIACICQQKKLIGKQEGKINLRRLRSRQRRREQQQQQEQPNTSVSTARRSVSTTDECQDDDYNDINDMTDIEMEDELVNDQIIRDEVEDSDSVDYDGAIAVVEDNVQQEDDSSYEDLKIARHLQYLTIADKDTKDTKQGDVNKSSAVISDIDSYSNMADDEVSSSESTN